MATADNNAPYPGRPPEASRKNEAPRIGGTTANVADRLRRRILDDHSRLRGLLAELESLLDHFQAGHPDAGPLLRERGRTLQRFFLDHLALEDAILLPALRDADAWGRTGAGRSCDSSAANPSEMACLSICNASRRCRSTASSCNAARISATGA